MISVLYRSHQQRFIALYVRQQITVDSLVSHRRCATISYDMLVRPVIILHHSVAYITGILPAISIRQ